MTLFGEGRWVTWFAALHAAKRTLSETLHRKRTLSETLYRKRTLWETQPPNLDRTDCKRTPLLKNDPIHKGNLKQLHANCGSHILCQNRFDESCCEVVGTPLLIKLCCFQAGMHMMTANHQRSRLFCKTRERQLFNMHLNMSHWHWNLHCYCNIGFASSCHFELHCGTCCIAKPQNTMTNKFSWKTHDL